MPKISKRANQVIASPIRKFLPKVLATEERGLEVIKLNVGDPDLTPPSSFWRTIKNFRAKNLHYAPSSGIREHVLAWQKYYRTFGIHLQPENIIPTVGGAEAILLAFLTVADPGEEILVFEPLYSSYKGFATMAGVKLVPVTLKIEQSFVLPDRKEIRKKINRKTKAIVVINPNNPTGTILSKKEIKTVISLANQYNLFIIADETYREIIFSGLPTSFLKFPQVKNKVIVVDSVSKRFSLPGARLGCLASYNQEVMKAVLKLAMVRLSAPALEQYGLIPLLKHPSAYTRELTAEYKRRKETVINALKKIPGIVFHEPQGAFYLLIKLPIKDVDDFVNFMLTKFNDKGRTVLMTPAEDFYITPHLGRQELRIAYVLNCQKLKLGIGILKKGLADYLKSEAK